MAERSSVGIEVMGLDLGDGSTSWCRCAAGGQVLAEGRVRTQPAALRRLFAGGGRSRVLVETGSHALWVARELRSQGHEVCVLHARSLRAITRADVAILVIDAVEGLTAQDAHVAGYVVEEGKGLVLAVNKWDIVADKTDRTFDQYVAWIRREAPFLDFAPVLSISAKTGQRVGRVLETAVDVWGESRKRIPTGELNRLVTEASARVTAPIGS